MDFLNDQYNHEDFFDNDFNFYDFLFDDDYAYGEDGIKNIDLLQTFRDKLTEYYRQTTELPQGFLHRSVMNPHEICGAIDLNEAFKVYDKLMIKKGYVFDYVYNTTTNGGYPLVYVRSDSEKPLEDSTSYFKRFGFRDSRGEEKDDLALAHGWKTYLNKITFEKSYIGFVQFAYFCALSHRFYLHWHSCRDFWGAILTTQDIDDYKILALSDNSTRKEEIETLTLPLPYVRLHGVEGDVFLSMCDIFGGSFYYVRFEIQHPHHYLDKEVITLFSGRRYLF